MHCHTLQIENTKLLRTLKNSTNEEPVGYLAAKFSSQLLVHLR